jgi:YVTN family beta-propeller protein
VKCGASGVVCLLTSSLVLVGCGGGRTPAPVAIGYVAHPQSHSMSVINIPADKLISTVQIGDSSFGSLTQTASYPQRVAVRADGSRAYVTDASTSVWIVDTQANAAVGRIEAGSEPIDLALSPDGKNLYVTSITCGALLCSGPTHPAQQASLEVIDMLSASIKATITFGKTPDVFLSAVALAPDSSRAFVANAEGNEIWVIDTQTNSISDAISTGRKGISDLALSADGKSLYAISFARVGLVTGFFLDVIDTKSNNLVTSIALGDGEVPLQVAVTPDGHRGFVTGDSGHMWLLDVANNQVAGSLEISAGNPLTGGAITPDGTRVYVTCSNNSTIYAVSAANDKVVDTIARSDNPGGLTIGAAR